MKLLTIATTTLALSVSMAFASQDIGSIEQRFALENDSAAERVVPETSEGHIMDVKRKISVYNNSAAERDILLPEEVNAHSEEAAKEKFAKTNDSAAERNVHYH